MEIIKRNGESYQHAAARAVMCSWLKQHKNELSEAKIAKLKKLDLPFELQIWRVEAHWVLSQIDYPQNFPEYGIRRVG